MQRFLRWLVLCSALVVAVMVHGAPAYAHPAFAPMTPVTRGAYPDIGYPGSCMWYALHERPDIPPVPVAWAYELPGALARAYPGFHQGNTPQWGALVIFARGVQGASWDGGHAAIVIAVAPGGRFLIAAMHAPSAWVVSYSWHTAAPGIRFIY